MTTILARPFKWPPPLFAPGGKPLPEPPPIKIVEPPPPHAPLVPTVIYLTAPGPRPE